MTLRDTRAFFDGTTCARDSHVAGIALSMDVLRGVFSDPRGVGWDWDDRQLRLYAERHGFLFV